MIPASHIAGRVATVAVAAAIPLLSAQAAAGNDPVLEEWATARVVTQRLRILPDRSAEPGACLEIGVDDLEIRLRGRRIDGAASSLDRQLTENIHGILIDTSPSMDADLERAAEAAADYVRDLPLDRDRAFVATFDHRVTLRQSPTADRRRLLERLTRLHSGMTTRLFDALIRAVDEASVQRERPVVIVLTDGHDVGSLHEPRDVRELVAAREDLTIFTIAFRVPEITRSIPTGMLASRRLLARLSERTGGAYFPVHSGRKLAGVYRRIREMLESEAVLTVIDPEPEDEPGSLTVKSRVSGCEVRVLPGGPAAIDRHPAEFLASPNSEAELPLSPGRAMERLDYFDRGDRIDPACLRADGSTDPWYVTLRENGIEGCHLDITMEGGTLYDPYAGGGSLWTRRNPIGEVTTRLLQIDLPPLDALPDRPEDALDLLAGEIAERIDRPIEHHPTKVPERLHARPHYDLPSLAHGSALFELRPIVARALFARDDYRDSAVAQFRVESDRELERLRERLVRLAQGATERQIRQVLDQGAEAERIRRRVAEPTEADLVRVLGAWLGDLTAYELLLRWERLWIERWIAGEASEEQLASFETGWRALHRLLFAPSYVHTLTLLTPVREAETGRVGFYRILLPDLRRLGRRVKGRERDGDLGGADLDLLPDRPLALRALQELAVDRPDLLAEIRGSRLRLEALDYRLLGPARRWFPDRAFRETRVSFVFRDPNEMRSLSDLRIAAEVELARDDEQPDPIRVGRVEVRTEDW